MKHAVYSGTSNLYGDMSTAAKSLIANSDVGRIWLLTEGDYDYWLPDCCTVLDVSGQEWFPPGGANYDTPYSHMTLMRAALALMPELEDVSRILSLDVDTVAVRRCSEVWDMPVDNAYFAAAQEKWMTRPGVQYCNTGVALYNLENLRDGKAAEIVDVLNRHWFRWPEQDVINYLCQGRVEIMDSAYNYCPWVVPTLDAPRIIHYAAEKTEVWRRKQPVVDYRQMSWDRALELHDEAVRRHA